MARSPQSKSSPGRTGSAFHRFAETASEYVSRGAFFAACVLLIREVP